MGDLSRGDLASFLAGARATLMPLRWHEPFGLVVVESLAVGTPVVAWNMGAMPEIIDDGLTGFLVEDVRGAVEALEKVGSLSREACRATAERRFGHKKMADSYVKVYANLLAMSSLRASDRPG